MPAARHIERWLIQPIAAPGRSVSYAWERAAGTPLLEYLRTEAELESVGRSRFPGTLKQQRRLWVVYRNFLRQALSNFRAALTVENRSASLIYYYAMLNFAKAELLRVRPAEVQDFVPHGLRFNGTDAQTVGGDYLTVRDGVFRMLYRHRTGYQLPVGARLPVKRLLANIPEIGQQLSDIKAGKSATAGALQLVAWDSTQAWSVLAISPGAGLEDRTATGRYFRRTFAKVDAPEQWKDKFAISRRWGSLMDFYESRKRFPFIAGDGADRERAVRDAGDNTWSVKDVLAFTGSGMWDGLISPSLYRTRMVPMPPSLARYAMAFYASSLVRYRPAMFDTKEFPEQAYLFDSLARECAVPMLVDTLNALTGTDTIFIGPDGLRR